MSALRLYLDEDATQHALVEALRMRDVDVTFALEVRMRAASDEDQLVWCEREGRVLDSFNVKDFSRLHKTFAQMGKPHCGMLVALQQRYSIGGQMRRILKLMSVHSAEAMRNRIEFLSAWD